MLKESLDDMRQKLINERLINKVPYLFLFFTFIFFCLRWEGYLDRYRDGRTAGRPRIRSCCRTDVSAYTLMTMVLAPEPLSSKEESEDEIFYSWFF